VEEYILLAPAPYFTQRLLIVYFAQISSHLSQDYLYSFLPISPLFRNSSGSLRLSPSPGQYLEHRSSALAPSLLRRQIFIAHLITPSHFSSIEHHTFPHDLIYSLQPMALPVPLSYLRASIFSTTFKLIMSNSLSILMQPSPTAGQPLYRSLFT
jgi:hypothetical protein